MRDFKDDLSYKEFKISGMRQECQDKVFKAPEPKEERIEPIFRDLFWKRKEGSKMTECNLFDGYCTYECEECPNQVAILKEGN